MTLHEGSPCKADAKDDPLVLHGRVQCSVAAQLYPLIRNLMVLPRPGRVIGTSGRA
jgi:hypothetical protein